MLLRKGHFDLSSFTSPISSSESPLSPSSSLFFSNNRSNNHQMTGFSIYFNHSMLSSIESSETLYWIETVSTKKLQKNRISFFMFILHFSQKIHEFHFFFRNSFFWNINLTYSISIGNHVLNFLLSEDELFDKHFTLDIIRFTTKKWMIHKSCNNRVYFVGLALEDLNSVCSVMKIIHNYGDYD